MFNKDFGKHFFLIFFYFDFFLQINLHICCVCYVTYTSQLAALSIHLKLSWRTIALYRMVSDTYIQAILHFDNSNKQQLYLTFHNMYK